jgi:hypothetical protein
VFLEVQGPAVVVVYPFSGCNSRGCEEADEGGNGEGELHGFGKLSLYF